MNTILKFQSAPARGLRRRARAAGWNPDQPCRCHAPQRQALVGGDNWWWPNLCANCRSFTR